MSKLSQSSAHPLPSSRSSGRSSNRSSASRPRVTGPGSLFGVPIGDLGWFTTLLMGMATGFAAFFAATFCGIMGILFYNTAGHHTLNFALSYRRIGLPVGLTVAVLALSYLGSLWIRRHLRRA